MGGNLARLGCDARDSEAASIPRAQPMMGDRGAPFLVFLEKKAEKTDLEERLGRRLGRDICKTDLDKD